MKSLSKLFTVCLAAGVLAACGTTTTTPEQQPQTTAPDKTGTVPQTTVRATEPIVTTPPPVAETLKNTVYFDYDKYDILDTDRPTINGHAKALTQNRGKKVTLEGHCDERGTIEYNMALGEKRAKAVFSALTAQGVSKDQLKVVSYGESRPAAQGHDESAWQLNRRVEFVNQ